MPDSKIPVMESIAPSIYQPTFDIPESITMSLGDKKRGQRIKAIVSYTVIEKTKNYTILRINNFFLNPSARRF